MATESGWEIVADPVDTSTWEQKTLGVVRKLRLDPKNVRLEGAQNQVDADLMKELFETEDAMALVKEICSVGHFAHELPIAVERGGKTVVVEGNRRLAALKAIQNPKLVPAFTARIEREVGKLPDRSKLAKIKVLVAPSQEDADRVIAALHTKQTRRSWSPARQAAFFQTKVDEGATLGELVDRYPTTDVRKFVLRARVVNFFKSLTYATPSNQDFVQSQRFKKSFSTIERIYESAEFLERTKLRLDADGELEFGISQSAMEAIAVHIIDGIETKEYDTRTLGSVDSDAFKQLLAAIDQILADDDMRDPEGSTSTSVAPGSSDGASETAQPGTSDSSDSTDSAPTPATEPEPAEPGESANGGTSPGGPQAKRKKLDMDALTIPGWFPPATKALFDELANLNVDNSPQLAYLGTRAVLERSVKAFADHKGKELKGHGEKGFVQLGHALGWLEEYVKTNGPRALVQSIQTLRDSVKNPHFASLDAMNAVNHNHLYAPAPDDARALWTKASAVLTYILTP